GKEYVVKLATSECGKGGLLKELIASQLANYFGILCPSPAIVRVGLDFCQYIPETEAFRQVIQSPGAHFGCELFKGGFNTWSSNKPLPPKLKQSASDIFFFDMLIQNSDRRTENPNLLHRDNQLVIIDHEMAFSFLYDLTPSDQPWQLRDQRRNDAEKHLFYQELKSNQPMIDVIGNNLSNLTDQDISTIVQSLPQEWVDDETDEQVNRIAQHLSAAKDHAEEFVAEIKEVLA
ncbi:MAG: hypothetical protein QGG64_02080, partial [Candidatus Latescibacteria bacterium]|nr:hypothetical protein [Candidatus Latescibacterota bacterium]